MNRINIPTRLFGLNKQDVSEHIDNLSKDSQKSLDELGRELARLQKEKSKLETELSQVQKEEIKYEDEIVESPAQPSDNKTLDEAYKRLEKTVALINMVADEESSQLVSSANKKIEEYDRMIQGLQDDIDEKKKRIEALLSNVLGILKANVDNVTSKIKDKEKLGKTLADPESLREKLSQYIDEDVAKDDELPVTKKAAITADGTSLSGLPKLLMFQNKYGIKPREGKKTAEEEQLLPADELEDFTRNHDVDLGSDPAAGLDKWYDDIPDEFGEVLQQAEQQAAVQSAPAASEEEGHDIKKMRDTLIIGKVAGENIFDGENNIIIPKGKVLTEEDVAVAERESKLAELIINMSLPK